VHLPRRQVLSFLLCLIIKIIDFKQNMGFKSSFNRNYLRMKNVVIPKKENKTKRLFVPVTPAEHTRIMKYCSDRQVKLSELIRYSLNQTYELL